jgi:hypothetical protein
MLGTGLGPDPTLSVSVGGTEGAGDVFAGVTAVAIGFARGLVRFAGAITVMSGSTVTTGV